MPISGVSGLLLAALVAVEPTALPAPTPLKTIENMTTSPACELVRENVAPSVGAVLRNDVAIQQAGTPVVNLVTSVNAGSGQTGKSLDADSPYANMAVALAQIQLATLGNRIVRNIAEIDRELADPKFENTSDPQLLAIRTSLQQVVEHQKKVLRIIDAVSTSDHPSLISWYTAPIQEQIELAMRVQGKSSVVSGDIFGPLAWIANDEIAQTHRLETATASQIATVASRCGYTAADAAPTPATDEAGTDATVEAPASAPDNQRDAAARAFYNALVSGNIASSHLSDALTARLTPSFVETVSTELGALKAPAWQYIGERTTSAGPVNTYRLSYRSGATLYYSFGTDAAGTIVGLFIGTQPPH